MQQPFPECKIMDEPTAALGVPEQRKVLELIDTLKKSSIASFISHNLNDIFSASDSICVLRQGKKVCEKMISQTNKDEIVSYMVRGEALLWKISELTDYLVKIVDLLLLQWIIHVYLM